MLQRLAYPAIQVAAAVMILLSFSSWMNLSVDRETYRTVVLGPPELYSVPDLDYHGDDISALSAFGDGWLSAGIAFVIFLAALIAQFWRSHIVNSIVSVGGALIAALLLYIVADGWPGSPLPVGILRDTNSTWEFWIMLGLAIFCWVVGFAMLLTHRPDPEVRETEEIAWA
jgi:hypothetical protein